MLAHLRDRSEESASVDSVSIWFKSQEGARWREVEMPVRMAFEPAIVRVRLIEPASIFVDV